MSFQPVGVQARSVAGGLAPAAGPGAAAVAVAGAGAAVAPAGVQVGTSSIAITEDHRIADTGEWLGPQTLSYNDCTSYTVDAANHVAWYADQAPLPM